MEDLYALLEVSRDASDAEIKKSYRNLIKKYHPDLHPGDTEAEERFKKINAAYSVLGDPEKRANYDRFGTEDAVHGDIFGDLFNDVFGGFNINMNMSGARINNRAPRQGNIIEKVINISLLEAAKGTTYKLSVNKWHKCDKCNGTGAKDGKKPETCSRCNGTGQVQQVQRSGFAQMITVTTCPECHGSGEVIKEKCNKCKGIGQLSDKHDIEVAIPRGVENGTRLRVAEAGEAGINGGPPGDLILVIIIKNNQKFTRDRDDLHMDLKIKWPIAVLGGKITIETLTNDIETITIPAGIQYGEIIKINNKGMPNMRDKNRYGNLYIHINIDVPRKLNEKQKALVEELLKEMNGGS